MDWHIIPFDFSLWNTLVHFAILSFIGYIIKWKTFKISNRWIPLAMFSFALINEIIMPTHGWPALLFHSLMYSTVTIGIHQYVKTISDIAKCKGVNSHCIKLLTIINTCILWSILFISFFLYDTKNLISTEILVNLRWFHMLIHIGVLLVIGFIIKHFMKKINNRFIPIIILILGIMVKLDYYPNILRILITGMLYAFITVGTHQILKCSYILIRKSTNKHKQISHKWDID